MSLILNLNEVLENFKWNANPYSLGGGKNSYQEIHLTLESHLSHVGVVS